MLDLKSHLKYILIAILIILVQVLIFNNVKLFDWLNPLVYSFFVFIFPIRNRSTILIYAFLIGLSIDYFTSTQGLNAFALTFLAFVREPIWRWFGFIRDENNIVSKGHVRVIPYFFSIFLMILIHHILIFGIERARGFDMDLILKTLLSSVVSFVVIVLFYIIFRVKLINGEE